MIAADDALSRRAEILTSMPGVAEVTAAALMAKMPELGRLEAKAAASLAGLAPVTRESGAWKGRSFIRGGRSGARRVLFMAALTAITHNPDMARKYRQLRARGKPAKVALTAVMRKLVVLANALLQQDRPWSPRAVPETGSAGSPGGPERSGGAALRLDAAVRTALRRHHLDNMDTASHRSGAAAP